MKPVYLGGVRSYQSAVYKPGMGWNGQEIHGARIRRPLPATRERTTVVSPLSVARQRRPGAKTKVAIIATMAAVAAVLTLVLGGGAHL